MHSMVGCFLADLDVSFYQFLDIFFKCWKDVSKENVTKAHPSTLAHLMLWERTIKTYANFCVVFSWIIQSYVWSAFSVQSCARMHLEQSIMRSKVQPLQHIQCECNCFVKHKMQLLKYKWIG